MRLKYFRRQQLKFLQSLLSVNVREVSNQIHISNIVSSNPIFLSQNQGFAPPPLSDTFSNFLKN